eukprot:TRINITY_DN12060_c0_g1_i2.p1 TRINITY_DN12060_c0_g1~~TRINITY_DN12060_c0_g1_i2.p1  ORF type:complete len:354 (+),score=35.34 TRINITY_DN12060_c0_g1_i2:93-1154(+)
MINLFFFPPPFSPPHSPLFKVKKMVLSVAEFKRHKWLVATAVIGLLLVVSQASGPRGKVEVAEEKASSKMAVVKLLKEVADIPRAESNVIPTMAPKMPNTRAAYIRCLDSIFSRAKDLSHCTFMPTPSKRLYAIVGDSTGRMQAQTVNPRFPIHNPHQKSPDYYVASSPRVEEGKSVDITTTLLVTNRLKDLSRLLMERMDRIAQERGIPDIVLFSGLALHECTMHHKNTDPLYRSVVEHKMGPKYNFTAAQGIGDLALHLAVPDYMLVQRECTLDLLKEFRLKYPTTTMIWRVLASASELFEGGVDRTYDVESCKKQSKPGQEQVPDPQVPSDLPYHEPRCDLPDRVGRAEG